MVEFVSYDGEYPNLCSGNLVLKIDGKIVHFPKYCMHSGGSVSFTNDWDEIIDHGEWLVDVPDKYKKYEKEINYIINANVRYGCCGGCV